MTDWVRLWHDMPTDPKWRVIARKSGLPLPCVIALFTLLMTAASSAEDRGSIAGLTVEDAAAALDMDEDDITAILAAMEGRVIAEGRLSGWDRRQPKREDNSVGRVRAYRERKEAERNAPERWETHADDVKRNVTQRNAPEKSRADTETEGSVSNETALIDPEKVMFDSGVALLTSCGKSEDTARKWLGRAKKDYGPELVITMIGRAKREGAPDPIAFMEGGFRAKARASPAPVVGV